MIWGYLLKSFKLVIIIFNLSFFLGMFWLIFCEVTLYLFNDHYTEQTNFFMKQLENEGARNNQDAQLYLNMCLDKSTLD